MKNEEDTNVVVRPTVKKSCKKINTLLPTSVPRSTSEVLQLYPADGKIPKNYSRIFCSSQASSSFMQADYPGIRTVRMVKTELPYWA